MSYSAQDFLFDASLHFGIRAGRKRHNSGERIKTNSGGRTRSAWTWVWAAGEKKRREMEKKAAANAAKEAERARTEAKKSEDKARRRAASTVRAPRRHQRAIEAPQQYVAIEAAPALSTVATPQVYYMPPPAPKSTTGTAKRERTRHATTSSRGSGSSYEASLNGMRYIQMTITAANKLHTSAEKLTGKIVAMLTDKTAKRGSSNNLLLKNLKEREANLVNGLKHLRKELNAKTSVPPKELDKGLDILCGSINSLDVWCNNRIHLLTSPLQPLSPDESKRRTDVIAQLCTLEFECQKQCLMLGMKMIKFSYLLTQSQANRSWRDLESEVDDASRRIDRMSKNINMVLARYGERLMTQMDQTVMTFRDSAYATVNFCTQLTQWAGEYKAYMVMLGFMSAMAYHNRG